MSVRALCTISYCREVSEAHNWCFLVSPQKIFDTVDRRRPTPTSHLSNAPSPSVYTPPMRSIGVATFVASSLVLLSNSVSAFSCHPSATTAASTAGVTQLSFKADCAKEVDLRESKSLRKRIGKVWGRMDTMRSAGLTTGRHPPMQMGFKSNVGMLVAAFLFKWYRARFINKIPVWDRQVGAGVDSNC